MSLFLIFFSLIGVARASFTVSMSMPNGVVMKGTCIGTNLMSVLALSAASASLACNPAPTPTPTPTPTTAPAIQASTEGVEKPTPERGFNLNLASSLAVYLARGETVGRVLALSSGTACPVLPSVSGLSLRLYRMPLISTANPSFQGAITGNHYDPLIPVLSSSDCTKDAFLWLDISASSAAVSTAFSIGPVAVAVHVYNFTMPAVPSMPLYMEFEPGKMMTQYGIPASANVSQIAPDLLMHLSDLRAHRIEPMKQRLADPSLGGSGVNVDQWPSGSFRQTEMTGSIAPVDDIAPQAIGQPWATAPLLSGWNSTIAAESLLANSWAYITDEPTDLAGTATRAELVRSNAPLMKTMVTHEPVAQLLGLIDHFTVVFEYFKQTGHWTDYSQAPGYWIYGGCMSHGSCSNGTVGTLTGTPDMMLDENDVQARAFPVVAYALGAQAALYYDTTQAWSGTPWISQYLFAGNGDGTLLYPLPAGTQGMTVDTVGDSIRLKAIREGMFDIEYAKASGVALPVPDQFTWSRKNSDYDAMRQSAAAKMGW